MGLSKLVECVCLFCVRFGWFCVDLCVVVACLFVFLVLVNGIMLGESKLGVLEG